MQIKGRCNSVTFIFLVKSSKPSGSTRYRRIPREPKQRKRVIHTVCLVDIMIITKIIINKCNNKCFQI